MQGVQTMDEQISFCGLTCNKCPMFKATQTNDNKKRAEIAQSWGKYINRALTAEDINCDGCIQTDGRLFGECNHCEVRNCGMEKGIDNCAYCDEFDCDKLARVYAHVVPWPFARAKLEEIRNSINKTS
jgi:hypothetical protein